MRLLDALTLEFHTFTEGQVPPYLVLSRTWREGHEVNYQDMRWLQALRLMPKESHSGYPKILNTAQIAVEQHIWFIWVDTVCIDKSSSSEPQEANNSMYQWYKTSHSCVVYLDDITTGSNENMRLDSILETRWITRGWTLQELIAPLEAVFYDSNWEYMCSKSRSVGSLSRLLAIPEQVIATGDTSDCCVANIMSWAASRQTTRVEDVAYSSLGLFDIQMPLLYGEGCKAFERFQEAIIQRSGDDSIFAWRTAKKEPSVYRGLLAKSPEEFKAAGAAYNPYKNRKMSITNLGLRVTFNLRPLDGGDDDQLRHIRHGGYI
ncbi:hypothetical protein M011DRAFT_492368 [Sporormia fimetaria CBS 119925]|uniref:Uncharacterized protein n=1 Tax=Sporormia fimetaria CBS 119925 TaxID=1340428 RepID=A0A6A6VNC5_9PLEO|nr:hypothetical protein M011DRAFT_492368 [Sporormia fimetaria CBS 119925]